MDEFCNEAYQNAKIYKERTKKWHDQKVLLFNSRLHLFPGKLKSRWSCPVTVAKVFPLGTMKVTQDKKGIFTMNGQCLKYYVSGELVGKRSDILLDPNK